LARAAPAELAIATGKGGATALGLRAPLKQKIRFDFRIILTKLRRFAPSKLSKLRVKPGSVEAYGVAVVCIAIAASVRALLGLIDNDIFPLPTFYPAVLIAAFLGGTQAGILATALGGLVAWWAFMPPHYTFVPLTVGQSVSLVTYGIAALIIVWGADHYRSITMRLEH